MTAHEKIVDKVTKLKAMAESAEAIGNEAEAEAFAAMYQRLMLQHKIEMSDLEVERLDVEEPVQKHRIDYTKYPDIELRKARIAWIERLASVVADAHFCRILVYPGSSRITLVGRKSDAAVAEYMFITLQRAVESLSSKAEQKYRWEVYKRDGNCRAARGYKGSFTQAFVMRLSERYSELRAEIVGDGGSMALVRVNTAHAALADFFNSSKFKTSTALRRQSDYHGIGARDGRRAADDINLKGKAVDAGTTRGQLR